MTDLKMHEDAKVAWCELLADPTIAQATGKLYGERSASDRARDGREDQYGFCCLGVLAKSQGATFEFGTEADEDEDGNDIEVSKDEATVELPTRPCQDLNDSEMLLQDFADSLGLTDGHQNFLSQLNDGGECTVKHDQPFFALYQKYAESESAPRSNTSNVVDPTARLFKMAKHSFAEIRQIILTEF